MLRLLGYTDRLSAAPGDTIRFMVSSDHDRYASRLVRLIHGDTNPAGPGFKQVLVPSTIDGVAAGPPPGPAERLVGDPAGPGGRARRRTSRSRSSCSPRRRAGARRSSRAAVVRSMATAGRCVVSEDGRARGGHRARRGADADRDGDRVAAVALVLRGADGRDGVAAVSHLPWRDPGADTGLATHREATGGGPIARRHGHAGPRGDGRRRPADAALRRSPRPAAS